MKNILSIFVFTVITLSSSIFSQNVGIGTTNPTSTLHIVPSITPTNPLRIEGLQIYTNETSVFAVDPNTGIVKHMPINAILSSVDSVYLDSTILSTVINNFDTIFGLMRDSLLLDTNFMNTLRDSVDSDIDSMNFANDTLYLYEDNNTLTAYINASTDTNLVDSLIIANSDTLYTIISDSLLRDSLWITSMDSLLSIYGDTIYFNDSSFTLVRDSLLGDTIFTDSLYTIISDSLLSDSLWLDSLGNLINDNDWNTNGNGTGLEAAAANNNVASGQYAIAAGFQDSATGQYATISGGGYNKALAAGATVGGGADNYATATWSTVAGGQDNVALNAYSSVGGGFNDTAEGDYAVVAGGIENKASSYGASILGGQANKATADYSTIGGGYLNNATGTHSFIGGGLSDTATGVYSVVVGGNQNKALSSYSSVLGGYQNYTNGSYSSVSGYRDSIIGSSYSNLAGGRENRITSSSYATVPGGYRNKVTSSSYSNVSGYLNNVTGSSYANVHGYNNYMEGSFNNNNIFGYRDTAIRTVEGSFIAGRENAIIAISPAVTGRNTIIGGSTNKIYVPVAASNGSYGHTVIGGFDNQISASPAPAFDRPTGIFSSTYSRIVGHPNGNAGSIILGGRRDSIEGSGFSVILSSAESKISNGGGWNSISGGSRNKITGQWLSGILAGSSNEVYGGGAAIVGGRVNTVASGANRSVIIGGDTNTVNNSADHAIVLGGQNNVANNYAQVTLGHYSTNTVPTGASSGAIDPDNILFKIGNGTDASNLNDAMVVKANGDIGIGTTTPLNTLHLNKDTGDTRLRIVADPSNTDESWNPGITMHQDGGAISSFIGLTGDADFGLTGTVYPLMFGNNLLFSIDNPSNPNSTFTNIYFSIDDTVKMTIKANGNVGIGTINPSESLEVVGNILASGTITPSDERYKTNIQTLDNSLAKLLKLRGVNYEMREEYKNKGFGEGVQVGVIAQEVEKIYPELIQTNSNTGYKGVDYSKFTPVLIEAIKEQQEIINFNKKEINSLKSENDLLKERLTKLENALNNILNR